MTYTLVTSFVLQNHDVTNQDKIDDYMNRFDYIRSLGIPTVLFLDTTLSMEETSTLKVIPTSIKDTWIHKFYEGKTPKLPHVRNESKDTFEYFCIQNSKPEWVSIAAELNAFNTDYFVWVDFGLSHVISNKENFQVLTKLQLTRDICIASITSGIHPFLLERICWRFAGGVFYCKKNTAPLFYQTVQLIIKQICPAITWEVNIWVYIEALQLMKIHTYTCDHNDTILTGLSTLT